MGLLKKAKSFVKKTVRKVVPKELSGIMTAAAPLLHHIVYQQPLHYLLVVS